MSKPVEPAEIITGRERRRRYTAEEKVRLVEETMRPSMTVSAVARLHGVSPSLLFRWRRRMAKGGHEAARADEEVVPVGRVSELEAQMRELERLLGHKTMETEICREALGQACPRVHAYRLPSPPPSRSSVGPRISCGRCREKPGL